MSILDSLMGKIIVSCQAMPNEPLYNEICMIAMMKSVVKGGAGALRVAGIRDVKNAKGMFDVPVIGITKPEVIPTNWKEIVYITPTVQDVIELAKAGADIIAFDGTQRKRPDCTLEEIIKYVHINGRIAMADVSTAEEGIKAYEAGADIISTTLSGYTQNSPDESGGPDFDLLENLINAVDVPVILEGRIWEPSQAQHAFKLGAHAVVIGSAVTRPQLITRRFVTNRGV